MKKTKHKSNMKGITNCKAAISYNNFNLLFISILCLSNNWYDFRCIMYKMYKKFLCLPAPRVCIFVGYASLPFRLLQKQAKISYLKVTFSWNKLLSRPGKVILRQSGGSKFQNFPTQRQPWWRLGYILYTCVPVFLQ